MTLLGSDPDRPTLLALRAIKLGDLLVAVPALHALRREFPEHRIVLATTGWLEPIVGLVGAVDEVLPTPGLSQPLRVEPGVVDVAVNLHGRGPESGGLLAAIEPRRLIAHRPDDADGPEWVDGVLERYRWTRLLVEHGIPADPEEVGIDVPAIPPRVRGATVVHVGAFYGARHWPADRFAEVASRLRAAGHRLVLTGGDVERERAMDIATRAGLDPDDVLAGRLDLVEFAAVVAAARLVVTVDTGAAHLASAYGIPSVVIFGPAPPEEWGPPESGPHIVLTDASVRRGDVFSAEPDPALLAVTVDDVIAAVETLPVR
ncbi:glycosyltransferase family 9 protein [Labedella phragmitis]|uniref:Glycosyltransferase family 9 protein n=1 Tax=Labedella phragmitis TaxID=2498849 RepID=A0A3S3ZAY4_9MICO|nr:glycosyltransferase family 9 protein [Labedella phragmitis]RWZ51533.1 glycosyltransferase family 9 protein [Labedella phragmitis]